ncbi:MAG: hypothetical protein CL610_13305 [Anaerolineaceae bacterium]|nr:hypothetical protein [Anaerolineaceae bacterium]
MLPVALAMTQEQPGPRLEITGLNPVNLPTVSVSVNVFDAVGQPVADLTAEDFSVVGELADHTRVVSVRSFSDEAIPINVVLAVDVSSSMAGTPIASARAAASTFVDAIGPNDPVAIVTFSSGARLVQEFTTDRDTLNNIINGLGFGGETFLFDGALEAVQTAADSDNPRRAVILLSDGAQYDSTLSSIATAGDVQNLAVINGVPVYTIGLGFGADRRYLEDLSANTNALFRESPTPEELEAIFSELANLLRTQYEVILEVDVPLDGTTYDLELEVETDEGVASATGRLRAPVPVPVVRLPELPDIISSLTEVQADIVADDGLAAVTVALDGGETLTLPEEPYLYIIDPVALAPGGHSLTFTATDEDGDVGTVSADFTVAALPSDVSINPALTGEIADVQTFTLEITGQTAPVNVTFSMDGGAAETLTEPYSFTIDPFNLAPGGHIASISVENEGGITATTEALFSVPDLPIQFSVSGLEAGQQVDGAIDIQVEVDSSQSPVTDIRFAVNGEPLEATADNAISLNALNLPPGPATLDVTAKNEIGQTTTESISFNVAALPPLVSLSGIELGDTLDANRTVEVDVISQTPVTSVNADVDGTSLDVSGDDPYQIELDVLAVSPGAHILTVEVTNEAGQTNTAEIAFTVAQGPSLTATALVPPTATETPPFTATTVEEATVTADTDATQQAASVDMTATADVEATDSAQVDQESATAVAQAVQATATSNAADLAATEAAQATSDAEATAAAEGTIEAEDEATTEAEATANALATLDSQATSDAQETLDAQATADLIATVNAQSTADALATTLALPTEDQTATQIAMEATSAAVETQAAVDQQATVDAEATVDAAALQAALNAQATETADAQETSDAEATANAQATETADAQETSDAEATANAQATETADAQETSDAEATANAQATETADAQETSDAEATTNAQATETADAQETSDAQIAAEETSAAAATEEITEEADDVTPTEAGTEIAQAVDDASATPTAGDVEDTPAPTITPIGTLIPAQAETTPANDSLIPIAVIVAIIVVVLLLIYFILNRARRRQRR